VTISRSCAQRYRERVAFGDGPDPRPGQALGRKVIDELLQVATADVAKPTSSERVRDVAQCGLHVVDRVAAVTATPLVQSNAGPGSLDEYVLGVVESGAPR
jgi:hypothetical protein